MSSGYRPVDPDEIRFHDHDAIDEAEAANTDPGWERDNVVLTTVGIDIGSTTSHLMFSRLHLQRLARELSSRFAVVERRVLYRSPILLTPFRDEGRIDVDALRTFIDAAYAEAGIAREEVDTGAVILTGAALERENARAVAELFAREGGKFVCASAGHRLEALLAAHGSGAVALSRERRGTVLNIDVGGGTTKLALVHDGEIVATSALAVGARLVALGRHGELTRVEPAARRLATDLGLTVAVGARLDTAARRKLADRMAELIVAAAAAEPGEPALRLLDPLPARPAPALVTFSGGVAEYLYGREREDRGDLGSELAGAILDRSSRLPAPVIEPAEGIRATVIGASQFSVQLSGNTIYVSDEALLPLRNLPVITVRLPSGAISSAAVPAAVRSGLERLDVDRDAGPPAVALHWHGEPRYADLRALAEGVLLGLDGRRPVVVAVQGDVGRSLGRIVSEELGVRDGVVVVDGLELEDLDFVDVGSRVRPANVVPVIVKSLLFAEAATQGREGISSG